MSSNYQGNKGLEYYKAYPRDFFEGTLGMSGQLRGFYRMVIDLIYMHDGYLLSDWGHIAGLTGYGKTQCRRMMSQLVDGGKIEVSGENDEFFTQKRAKNELKDSRKFQENQSKKAAKRWENNNLPDADASSVSIPPQDHKTTRQRPLVSNAQADLPPLFGGQAKKRPPSKPKVDAAFNRLAGSGGVSDEAVRSYLDYRKATKAKGTTERAAGMIAKQLVAIAHRGGDPDEALDMAQLQGWQGLNADWYFNKRGQDNGNGNSNDRGSASASGARRGGYHDALMAGFGQAATDVERGTRPDGFDHSEGFDASGAQGDRGQGGSDPH